jgi:membrane protease YdiL (CAAX protease family)
LKNSTAAFFALTFLLATPFYILHTLAYLNIVGSASVGPIYIAVFTVTPILSASILTFRERGSRGLKQLLGTVFDFKKIGNRRWYAAILLLPPLISLLSLGVLVLFTGPLPPPLLPFAVLPIAFLFFFLLAAGEEVGWMGYAFEPMQERGGTLWAALLLGMVWAFWRVPFFVFIFPDLSVISAQVVALVGTRVLLAWIYSNAGKSIFAAILFHAALNAAMATRPEVNVIGPLGAAIYCGFVLLAAAVVTWLWGPRTLARYRFSNRSSTRSADKHDTVSG